MGAKVKTAALVGVDGIVVEAEAEASYGLRRFSLVGLPDGVVKEAKDRVRCAIQNSGFEFPTGDITVSLAPAWLPKLGSGFDLAIAAAIIASVGLIPQSRLERVVMLGELSLDGTVRPVRGVIQAAVAAARLSAKRSAPIELLVAPQNGAEGACIGGLRVISVRTLLEAVLYLRGEAEIKPVPPPAPPPASSSDLSFADVVGQYGAKRALQIAAAGGHNLLLVGPPGAGKSMLAARYPALLPPLSTADSIEVTKIAAVATFDDSLVRAEGPARNGGPGGSGLNGGREWGLIRRRPFRAPHHSASVAGIIGGGPLSLPGEVTLAHRGVLFLDELSEFRREVLESLRQPLEAKRVVVSRARYRISYPSDFLLVAAMNPCPCGRFGVPGAGCQCGEQGRRAFYRRLSGPILDRIDLRVWVPPVAASALMAGEAGDSTAELAGGVARARRLQAERFGAERLNSSMTSREIKKWCVLDAGARALIEAAAAKQLLSARSVSKTIKTARTIADLDQAGDIGCGHVAEALQFARSDFFDCEK